MKTAVDYIFHTFYNEDNIPDYVLRIFEQAKKMEREQIINSFEIGYYNGAFYHEGNAIYHGNNYYNKKFKSE
jgi:hypothetical protein